MGAFIMLIYARIFQQWKRQTVCLALQSEPFVLAPMWIIWAALDSNSKTKSKLNKFNFNFELVN